MAKANSTASRNKRASAQNVFPVLKCRKGDLAIILSGRCSGQIVEVGRYYASVAMDDGEVLTRAWHVLHESDPANKQYFLEDKCLLPIRPGDLNETETDELSLTQGRPA